MERIVEKFPTIGIGISLLSAVFTLFMYFAAEKANEEAAKANELTKLMVQETAKANELTKVIANESTKNNELVKSMVDESAKANVLSEKTMEVIKEQKEIANYIYEKEESNKAVWASEALETFVKTFEISINVEVKLRNMSRYAQSIKVVVVADNICIYIDSNSIKCNNKIHLGTYTISPNDYYKGSFFIHVQEGHPEKAKVTVLVYDRGNDELIDETNFYYKKEGNYYSCYEN